jgi:hypothetical protein
MMAAVPGRLAKLWLDGPHDDVYGGIYLWRDREAFESFLASELWASVVGDDSVSDLASHDFAVMEELTKTTQPVSSCCRTRHTPSGEGVRFSV